MCVRQDESCPWIVIISQDGSLPEGEETGQWMVPSLAGGILPAKRQTCPCGRAYQYQSRTTAESRQPGWDWRGMPDRQQSCGDVDSMAWVFVGCVPDQVD